MIPIPLLVFRLIQAFGTAKGFVNMINNKTIVSLSFSLDFHTPVNSDKAIWLLLRSTFSVRKKMMPIPFLVFHLLQHFVKVCKVCTISFERPEEFP